MVKPVRDFVQHGDVLASLEKANMQNRKVDTQNLLDRLSVLIGQHRRLALEVEQNEGHTDLALHRLKKEKLLAKDRIAMLQSQLGLDRYA